MIRIDQFASINRIASVHPLEKIGLTLIALCSAFLFTSPATLLSLLCVMTALLPFRAGIPSCFLMKLYLLPFLFLVPGILAIVLQPMEEEAALAGFHVAGHFLGISSDGISLAFLLALRTMAAISCFYFLILTTRLTDILLSLKKLRMPELFLELTSLTYRFIFLVLETSDRIRISQESRLGASTFKNRLRSLSLLMANLLLLTMNRSDQQYQAMESRCYDGSFRLLERNPAFSPANVLFIVAFIVALCVVEFVSGGRW